jgi:hypothetical protein
MSSTQDIRPHLLRRRIGAVFAFRESILILVLVVGGAIMTNCGSICSAAKNPLSLPK